LLTGELKEITAEKLAKFLEEHRKKKENAKKDLEKMMYSGRLAKKMWETTY
jgi:tryptophanyl-tRNA synthetase